MAGTHLLDESSKSEKWLPVLDRFPPSTDCYTPLISIEGSIPREWHGMKRNYYFTF